MLLAERSKAGPESLISFRIPLFLLHTRTIIFSGLKMTNLKMLLRIILPMHTRLLMLLQMGLSVWFLKIGIVNSSWWYGNIRRGVSKQMFLHLSGTNYICRCTYMVTVNCPLVRGYYLWISEFSKVSQLQLNLWLQVPIQKYEHPTEHWLIQEIWNKWQCYEHGLSTANSVLNHGPTWTYKWYHCMWLNPDQEDVPKPGVMAHQRWHHSLPFLHRSTMRFSSSLIKSPRRLPQDPTGILQGIPLASGETPGIPPRWCFLEIWWLWCCASKYWPMAIHPRW